MLTKDLLQYTHRKGKITPTFVDESRPALVRLARDLVKHFEGAVGLRVKDIEDRLSEVTSSERSKDGLAKLLLDRCEFEEIDPMVMERRWELFRTAQNIRDDVSFDSSELFREELMRRSSMSSEQLNAEIFSDHPDEKRCIKFETTTHQDVLSDYNRALFQTLMIFADDVRITIANATIVQKRAFFRGLKFFGLMSEVAVDPHDATLTVYLTGPLRLFQKSATYGLKLAKFMPTVLNFSQWHIESNIALKNRKFTLTLDQSSGLQPKQGRGLTGYVPPEYQQIASAFSEQYSPAAMTPGEDFIHLGSQSYCFPDFDIKFAKKTMHVELFHPWHRGQLLDRIKSASVKGVKNYLVGVDKTLLKDSHVKAALSESKFFEDFGFEFSQFPTPRQIAKKLGA
jgi:predicted nuclease of restriction endonuclease-like RecB superfamily